MFFLRRDKINYNFPEKTGSLRPVSLSGTERRINRMKLNRIFDHPLLAPEATQAQIRQLCSEAREWDFYSVCVNSGFVSTAARELRESNVKITSVVGFPLGACTSGTKAAETEDACRNGAAEIDMVIPIGRLRDGDDSYVLRDIQQVTAAAAEYGADVKVILETGLLSDEEILRGCDLAERGGARFVKTSTGFLAPGADVRTIRLMKQAVGDRLLIKASGGIRSLSSVKELLSAGADRIGASSSVSIMMKR